MRKNAKQDGDGPGAAEVDIDEGQAGEFASVTIVAAMANLCFSIRRGDDEASKDDR